MRYIDAMNVFSRWFRKTSPAPVERSEAEAAIEPVPQNTAAQSAEEETQLAAALTGRDRAAIARFVLEGSSSKLRQRAAQAVEDPAELKRLMKESRGHDKNVYKILRTKCDALLATERAAAQLQEELNAVATALARHAQRSYDALYTPTLTQLETRWKALAEEASGELYRQAERSIERCRQTIVQHLKAIAAQAASELAAANIAAREREQRELAEAAAAQAAAEAAAIEAARRKALEEQQAAETAAVRQLAGLIGKARAALRDGGSGRAAGLRRAIEEKLPTAPPLPPHLTRQLQQLDEALTVLKDWKSFAAAPKRIQLIEAMEALVGDDTPPAALAEEIKRLQGEWKTISKGVAEETGDAEWQRFHEAAQKAYQPCKEYFAAQAQQRAANLEQRHIVLQRLDAFETAQDWEHADWALVATVLREAREEWRRHSPVDRAAGQAAQDSFDATLSRLKARLEEEYARNLRLKRSLIVRTQRLLAVQDSRKAMDDLKELQTRWKAAGPMPRDEDRKLWEEFRAAGDAVFQRRKQEYEQRTAEIRSKKAEEAALRRELEEAAAMYGLASEDGAGKFSQLQSAFESLGPEAAAASSAASAGR